MPQPIIDSHHHLWDYNTAEYGWIDPATMGVLARDYTVRDFTDAAEPSGVVGTVAVQARQTVGETDWLLEIARAEARCLGVVGWVPLRDAGVGETLERYRDSADLKGVRHVVQDEPDGFMLDPAFQHGISLLQDAGLVYDLLIFGRQLAEAVQLVDRFPEQAFVLDHIAKPTIRAGRHDAQWDRDFRELAQRENVVCKVSGMVTEVREDDWDTDVLRPYFETALDCFGPGRLMFGSDWPVCLLRSDYIRWVACVDALTAELSAAERSAFFYQNAIDAYGLAPPPA